MRIIHTNKGNVVTSTLVVLAVLFIAAGFIIGNKGAVYRFFADGYMQSAIRVADASTSSPQIMTAQATTNTPAPIVTEQTLVENAVAKANPAVVSIVISKNVPVIQQYYQHLGGGFIVPEYQQNGTQLQQVGGGSGFFVNSNGLIITNKHVVSDPNAQYTVFTANGTQYNATVVAQDPAYDIAFLKVSGSNFPYLTFANSDNIVLGQTAIAIGDALGQFRNSVTEGIVSGIGRSIVAGDQSGSAESLDQVIQTDAAINPGNSGGPLLDLNGNVIGVDVAVAQNAQSIGFALPANIAVSAVKSVEQTGKVVRPYLGVRYEMIDKTIQQQNNLTVDYGAYVTSGDGSGQPAVLPGSPAAQAGLTDGDVILQVDGTSLDENHTLAMEIQNKQVGDTVTLVVLHNGKKETMQVKLAQEPTQ